MQAGAHANDLAGDSRSLLIAFADGACQLFSWQGQVTPFGPLISAEVHALSVRVCSLQMCSLPGLESSEHFLRNFAWLIDACWVRGKGEGLLVPVCLPVIQWL